MAVTTAVSASSTDSTDRLVEILLRRRLMSAESVERVQAAARSSETPFSAVATRLGLVTEDQMAEIFAEMLAIEVAKRARFPARLPEIDGVNLHFFRTKRALPLVIDQDEVHLAMADQTDDVTAAGVEFLLGKPVKRYAALESELEDYFYKLDAAQAEAEEAISLASIGTAEVNDDDVAKLSDHASDAPVIRLVHRLIMSASDLGASDVHVEPAANALIIRYRIDGLLQEADVLSARWAEPVASRIKLMARLDIAERRVPQDGRIRFSARGRSLDLRVATFPTLHGESIVLRLLGQVSVKLELKDRKFNRYAASIPVLAARSSSTRNCRRNPPHFRKTRPPCQPAPRKTPVVWRLAGRWHRLTRRSAGNPPLPRDALIEFERRHRLRKRVGVAWERRLPQWWPARWRQ